jgi:hypothetical protein
MIFILDPLFIKPCLKPFFPFPQIAVPHYTHGITLDLGCAYFLMEAQMRAAAGHALEKSASQSQV